MITDTQYLPMGGRSGKEKLHKYQQAIVNDLKGKQAGKQAHEVSLLSWKGRPELC